MVKKKKITVDRLPGAEKKKGRRKKEKEEGEEEKEFKVEIDEEGLPTGDKRSYEKERCDDKDIPVEVGKTYYGGNIDTEVHPIKKTVDDVEAILAGKGIKL